jgi:hypothetical protein
VRRAGAISLAAIALALAGCGDDDNKASSTVEDLPPSETTQTQSETPVTPPPQTAPSPQGTRTGISPDAPSDDSGGAIAPEGNSSGGSEAPGE